jgi:hypothetical protein
VAGVAQATLFTVDATDGGWFRESGRHDLGFDNYCTGWFDTDLYPLPDGGEYRSFFIFPVPALDGPVISAQVTLASGDDNLSPQPTETLGLFSYTLADDPTLGYGDGNATGQSIFANLGSGASYGQTSVTLANLPADVLVILNATAWNDIGAAAGGDLIMGGALTTIAGLPGGGAADQSEYLFNNTADWPELFPAPVLSIVTRDQPVEPIIPEPATLALLGGALAAVASRRRRRR